MSKILLVEDNEMNRDMLSRRLERKGFEIVIAVDGPAGIDMASSSNPDTALTCRVRSRRTGQHRSAVQMLHRPDASDW